jgi:hypothetical protein
MTAQKFREDAREHAEKEGELMVREARLMAETARDEAARSLAREEETLRQVRARRAQLVESFRRLLERELSELAVIEESLELGGEAGEPKKRRARRKPEESASTGGEAAPASSDAEPGEPGEPADAGSGDVQEDWLSSLVEE